MGPSSVVPNDARPHRLSTPGVSPERAANTPTTAVRLLRSAVLGAPGGVGAGGVGELPPRHPFNGSSHIAAIPLVIVCLVYAVAFVVLMRKSRMLHRDAF